MTRRRTSPSARCWQAAGMLGALVLLGWGLYGIGMLLGAAARAVGVR